MDFENQTWYQKAIIVMEARLEVIKVYAEIGWNRVLKCDRYHSLMPRTGLSLRSLFMAAGKFTRSGFR
jgi:hypothetical protein